MNCEHKTCNQTAFVKLTFHDEEPYIMCNEHFNGEDPNVGKIFQQDNAIIEVFITR